MPIKVHHFTDYQLVVIDRDEKRGALDLDHIKELIAIFSRDHKLPLVLTGSGRCFCSGLDLSYLQQANAEKKREINLYFGQLLQVFADIAHLTVVVANGPVVAGGCGFVFAADYVVAHPSVYFRCPEIDIGVFPAQIYPYLARDMSQKVVKRWLLGNSVSLEEALCHGVISAVSPLSAIDWMNENIHQITGLHAFIEKMNHDQITTLAQRSDAFYPNED